MEFIDPYTLLIYRPDSFSVWHHDLIKERLNWYYSVMRGEKPAKFIIAKHVPIDIDPYHEGSIEELWSVHKKAEKEFQKISATRVEHAMVTKPVSVQPDTPINEIATLMVEKHFHTIPVVEGKKLVGIIGKEDILRILMTEK